MTHTNRPLVRRGARLKAFTLLELVIAVVVIAALAIIAIPTFVNDISNAALARDTASLTAFAGDAQSIARSTNLDVPDVSAVNFALTEMPKLTGGASWSGVASAHAHVVGSSAYGTVSYDATDAVTSSIGYAMRSQNGGCVMALTTPSETVSWHYNYDLGVNCDGSHALGGPAETAPTYSVGVPGPSSSVLATLSGVDALVSWNPPTSGGTGIVSYEVTASLGDLTCTTAGTDCVVSGLSEGQTYTFSVVATNGVGPGDASPPSNALTVPEPPSTPSDVVVVSSNDGTVSVSWAPSSAGGIPVTYRASDAAGDACTTSSTTCVVSGLTVGTSYTFAVVATSAAGSSEPSAGVSVVPLTTPDAPTDVLATSSDGAATVIWDAPTNDGGTPITGYSVTDGAGHTCSTTGAHSCVVTGLANGTSYTFTVEAINAAGPGPASLPSRVVTPAGAPSAPTSLIATSSTGAATVSWSAPSSDGGSTITNYHVTDGTGDGCSTSGALTCTVTGLTGGTSYTFTATATNSAGTSSASSASNSVTLPATPGAPRSVVATPGSHYATISWSAPASDGGAPITGYSVTDGSGDTCTTSGATTCTISGLTNGTSYTFTVTATNAVGTSSASSASPSITPSTAPGAPTSVTVVRHDRSVAVSWSAPTSNGGSAISDYSVTDGTGDVCSSSSLTCTVTGLTNGTSYTFTVTATNSAGTSLPSASSASVTPASIPDAPTTVIATSSTGAVTVSWTAPSDGGSAITSYHVSDGQGDSCSTSGALTCTVTALTAGGTFTFTVTATNAVGISAASASSNSVTLPTVPGVPTSVIATPGSHYATVSWSAPSVTGGAPITNYVVTSSPGSFNCSSSSTTCTVTGLTNGVGYTFTVTATNAVGDSASSASSAPITPATAPDAPTGISVVAHNHAVTVSWSAPSNNGGSSISSYSVTDGSGDVCSSSALTCTVTGLTNGTSYTFTVAATNSAGTSLPSSASSAVTPATTPDAPLYAIATSSTGAATVSWTAPTSNGGATISGYSVTDGSGDTCSTSGALTCTVTGLSAGSTYSFTIAATNAVGTGVASAPSNSVTLPTVPGAPTGVIATPGSHYATVTWSAPSVTGGAPIIGYTVSDGVGDTCTTSGATACTVSGLTNGTSYTFTVRATNAVGDSAASAASIAVTPATVPGAPTSVTVVAHNQSVTVSWAAPSNGGASISSYSVTDGSGDVCSSSALSCTVSGLTNGTSYTFTVSATNSVGTGASSGSSASVTPITVPNAPTTVIATASINAVALSWNAPSNNGGAAVSSYSATDGSGDTCSTSGATSCTVSGLTPGTAYTFTVSAANAAGTGASSASSNSATTPNVPGAPTVVIATPGSTNATVSWTASPANGSTVTNYVVTSTPGNFTCSTTSTTCTVSGLANGTGYTFKVIATNAVGNSAASAASSSVTPATTPGAPTGVIGTRGNASVAVVFSAPSSNGGATISSYTVTSSPSSLYCTATSPSVGCTVSGLTNGTAYTFTVVATNSAGPSSPSLPSASVTPATTPSAPSELSAAAAVGSATVTFTGSAPNGSTITSYTVTSSPGSLTCNATVPATGCSISGLTPGVSYSFTAIATNALGNSLPSAPSNSVTIPTVPSAPSITVVTPGSTNVTISWTTPSNGGSAITGYTLYGNPSGTCTTSGAT